MGIIKDWMRNSEFELRMRSVSIDKAILILKSIDKELNDSECARILKAAWGRPMREGLLVYSRVNTPPNVTTKEATEKSLEAIIRGERPYIYGTSIVDDGNNGINQNIEIGSAVLYWDIESFLLMMHHYGISPWLYTEVWEEHSNIMNTLLLDIKKASDEGNLYEMPNEFITGVRIPVNASYRPALYELYTLMQADLEDEENNNIQSDAKTVQAAQPPDNTGRNRTVVNDGKITARVEELEALVKQLEADKAALAAKVSEYEGKALESHQAGQSDENLLIVDLNNPYLSDEARIGLTTWKAVIEDDDIQKRKSPKQAIRKALDEKYTIKQLKNEPRERISILFNWKPQGGNPSLD